MITAWIAGLLATPFMILGVFAVQTVLHWEKQNHLEAAPARKMRAGFFFYGGALLYVTSLTLGFIKLWNSNL